MANYNLDIQGLKKRLNNYSNPADQGDAIAILHHTGTRTVVLR